MANAIKQYWMQLQVRERLVLGWGTAVVALILGYAVVWQPWHFAINAMEEALQPRRESLVWMQQQADLIQSGEIDTRTVTLRGVDQSLLSVIEQTAKKHKVRKAIQQMTPAANEGQVRVVLEQVNFNYWVRWIDELYKAYGVNISQVSAERDDSAPNLAEIRITFER